MKQPLVLLLGLLFLIAGCYEGITGTVIDSETGKPLEGAIVLVEWTITRGIGLEYTNSYQVVEVLTGSNGKFKVSGVFNPFVNAPNVTVYKKGYVSWNSEAIFPTYDKRIDFKWQDRYVFKLEKFKEEYSFDDHASFISNAIHSWIATAKKEATQKSYRWEEERAFEERKKRWAK
jgi:hypothetical protein